LITDDSRYYIGKLASQRRHGFAVFDARNYPRYMSLICLHYSLVVSFLFETTYMSSLS